MVKCIDASPTAGGIAGQRTIPLFSNFTLQSYTPKVAELVHNVGIQLDTEGAL